MNTSITVIYSDFLDKRKEIFHATDFYKRKERSMNKKKRRFWDCLMLLVLLGGILALAYPFVSDALNNYLDQQVISHYQKQAASENKEKMTQIQKKMEEKNRQLAKEGNNPGADPFEKTKEQPEKADDTYLQKHTLGILTIPKINVRLPIFDQTSAVLLEKGASLLEGTSYPTGGKSTHAVLSSHRGLPQAKLFTDLPKLVLGDTFLIEINKSIHAYQVDQIKTVEPTDTDDLRIEPDKDLVTLLTCTPYMINSHRLLVRGHRIPYSPEQAEKATKKVQNQQQLFLLLLIGTLLLIVGLITYLGYRIWGNQVIRHTKYPLSFQLQNETIQSITIQSLNKKKPSKINVTPNEEGQVNEMLSGGKYAILFDNGGEIRASIRHPKDKQFRLKRQNNKIVIQRTKKAPYIYYIK